MENPKSQISMFNGGMDRLNLLCFHYHRWFVSSHGRIACITDDHVKMKSSDSKCGQWYLSLSFIIFPNFLGFHQLSLHLKKTEHQTVRNCSESDDPDCWLWWLRWRISRLVWMSKMQCSIQALLRRQFFFLGIFAVGFWIWLMFELKTSPDIVQLIFLFSGGVIFNLAAFLLLPNPNSHLDRRVAHGLAVKGGCFGLRSKTMNLGWWMKNSLWITKISPWSNFGCGRVVFSENCHEVHHV